MFEVACIVVSFIALVCFIAWLMHKRAVRRPHVPEMDYSLRRPAVLQKLLAPLTFEDAVITEVVETRKASGIFVVMKPELVEQLAVIAKDKRMSRSGLCRELILRGLEAEVRS